MKTLLETRPHVTAAVLLLGLTAATLATAADLRVPADYPTIQAAVNTAHTNDIFGILIREGVGARIAGNTISGFSYVGTGVDFPISLGIGVDSEANYPAFGIAQPVIIEGNTLRDNQIHIALTTARFGKPTSWRAFSIHAL